MAAWLLNTAFVTVMATLTVTASSALVAWGFARYQFRGRNLLFGLVLASMMVPGATTMIPTYLIWNSLGMVGTLTPLWAGNLFGTAFSSSCCASSSSACRPSCSTPPRWTVPGTGRCSGTSRSR